MATDETALDDVVKTRRGPKPRLSADEIVDRALAIADSDSVDAVSLRRLAAELNVSHMALYRYFDAKEDLLEAMVARTVTVPTECADPSLPWDARLLAALLEVHENLSRRPAIAQLLAMHPFPGARFEPMRQRLYDLLHLGGFGDEEARAAVTILANYVLGAVVIDSSRTRVGNPPGSFEHGLHLLIAGLRDEAEAKRRA